MEHCSYPLVKARRWTTYAIRLDELCMRLNIYYRFLLLNLISIEAVLVTRQHTQRVI